MLASGSHGAMRALAVDTASPVPALAVVDAPGAGAPREAIRLLPPASAETLVGELSALLEDAGVELKELDRVAVLSGPGSFTGLRAGVAFARGLARALGIPLHAIETFRAAAEAWKAPADADFLLGAGRGDVHRARRRGGALTEDGRPMARGDALDEARREGVAVVELASAGRPLAPAAGRIALADTRDPASVSPAYGRKSAAEEKLERGGS
jgi:tRNA threonylcarbamoyladenosine biosynthesis protein TsaB